MGALFKGFLLLFVVLVCCELVSANVIINEIMYDPDGSDSGHEWIELYNNGLGVNISGWKFYEGGTNHGLSLVNGIYFLDEKQYAIIADKPDLFLADYPNFNGTLFDSTFSLKNIGEYLAIKTENLTIIDEINYSCCIFGINGKSLSWFDYGWNMSSVIGGSPGKENNDSSVEIGSGGLKLSAYIDDKTYVGIEYTSLFKIENLDHVSGTTDSIDVEFGYTISFDGNIIYEDIVSIVGLNSYKSSNTGIFNPPFAGNYTIAGWIIESSNNDLNEFDDYDMKVVEVIDTRNLPCNVSLNISLEEGICLEGESIKFANLLSDEEYPYIIEYWIEDSFENLYKNKYNTTNTNSKTWKTNIVEDDRILYIKSQVYPFCNDSNISDNSAEQMFLVAKSSEENEELDSESTLEIIDVEKSVNFGDVISVGVDVYRGDTGKYALSLYIDGDQGKVSEVHKIHIKEKYSRFFGKIPVQLKLNCDLKYESGKYYVVLEGLGEKEKKNIKIKGIKEDLCDFEGVYLDDKDIEQASCKTTLIEDSYKGKTSNLAEYNLINQLLCTDRIHYKEIVYESTNEKIKKLIQPLLIFIMALLLFLLLYNREPKTF
jgi:hypothetical protein